MVCATPQRAERELLDGLQDVVQRRTGPLILLGDYNKDALQRPAYQDRLRVCGYKGYPTRWAWTWRGVGAHAHEESITKFIIIPHGIPVMQVQVLRRISVRTYHRMVVAEVKIQGAYRRLAQTRQYIVSEGQWRQFKEEHTGPPV